MIRNNPKAMLRLLADIMGSGGRPPVEESPETEVETAEPPPCMLHGMLHALVANLEQTGRVQILQMEHETEVRALLVVGRQLQVDWLRHLLLSSLDADARDRRPCPGWSGEVGH